MLLATKCKETVPKSSWRRSALRRTFLLPAVVLFSSLLIFKGINDAFVATRSPRIPERHLRHAGAQNVDVMERVDAAEKSKEELLKASELLEMEMEKIETELRKATAFKLPERDELRTQAESLQIKIKKIADELDELQKLAEPAAAESLEEDQIQETSAADSPTQKAPLSERLSWEKLEAMSNEERLALTQEIGPAFGVSVGIVAFVYWSITLPILLNAYYQSTGEWPRFEELFSLSDGGRTAGAVAGILGLAALMKPLRIAAAIALTPWTADHVLPLIPWLNSAKEEKEKSDKP
eukprot:s1306_g3.t1